MMLKSFLITVLMGVPACAVAQAQPLIRMPQMNDIWRPVEAPSAGVLCFSPDLRSIITTSKEDHSLQLWRYRGDSSPVFLQSPANNYVHDKVVFSSDGKLIAGVFFNPNEKQGIMVWDAGDGTPLASLEEKVNDLAADNFAYGTLAWTSQGPTVLTGGSEQPKSGSARLRVWDISRVRSHQLVLKRTDELLASAGRQRSMAISRDGNVIAGYDGSSLTIWNSGGEVLHSWPQPPALWLSHSDYRLNFDDHCRIVISPDDTHIAVLSQGSPDRDQQAQWNLCETGTGRWQRLVGSGADGLAFSPDSKLVASGCARLWDAASGNPVATVGTRIAATAVSFSPGGDVLASGGESIVLWDVKKLLTLHGAAVQPIQFGAPEVKATQNKPSAFANYGYTISVASRPPSNGVHNAPVWEVQKAVTGQAVADLPPDIYSGQVQRTVTAVSPGARFVAVVDWDQVKANGLILLWDVAHHQALRPIVVPKEFPDCLKFSPDCRLLAATSQRKRLRIWQVSTGSLLQILPIGRGGDEGLPVLLGTVVGFSPDSKTVAAPGTEDFKPINLWDVRSGRLLRSLHNTYAVSPESVSFSAAGDAVAIGGSLACVWDLKDQRPRRIFRTAGVAGLEAQFAGDGSLYLGEENGDLQSWNCGWLKHPPVTPDLTLANGCSAPSQAEDIYQMRQQFPVSFSRDGGTIAAVAGSFVRVWNSVSGKLVRTAKVPAGAVFSGSEPGWLLTSLRTGMRNLVAAPTGNVLAGFNVTGHGPDEEGSPAISDLKLWDAHSHKLLRTLARGLTSVTALAFSPDGTILATGVGREVMLFDVHSGARRRLAAVGDFAGMALAFSPDGHTLAAASLYGFVHLWDTASGELLRTLTGHTGYVTAVAFSPDGTMLASGSEDLTVRLWDAVTGAAKGVFEGHHYTVADLAFSPDSQRLASSCDGMIKVWLVHR